ncbi:hypothetical protein K438DRAFT_685074 [Mycena galopus ATCC 62051]|nr:hypothetical protein K438DRAFT_685074 [Mycena galopus ATCC 62051]
MGHLHHVTSPSVQRTWNCRLRRDSHRCPLKESIPVSSSPDLLSPSDSSCTVDRAFFELGSLSAPINASSASLSSSEDAALGPVSSSADSSSPSLSRARARPRPRPAIAPRPRPRPRSRVARPRPRPRALAAAFATLSISFCAAFASRSLCFFATFANFSASLISFRIAGKIFFFNSECSSPICFFCNSFNNAACISSPVMRRACPVVAICATFLSSSIPAALRRFRSSSFSAASALRDAVFRRGDGIAMVYAARSASGGVEAMGVDGRGWLVDEVFAAPADWVET